MKQGDFVWHELCTADPAAAADFLWQGRRLDGQDLQVSRASTTVSPASVTGRSPAS